MNHPASPQPSPPTPPRPPRENDAQEPNATASAHSSSSTPSPFKRRYPPVAEEDLQVDDSATVLEKIAKIYAERLLCDITLNVGGSSFPAHRLILCASSDVFQVMLMNPNWSESQETTVVLQEEPQCAKVFADFLKYLYTGKIKINHYSVLPLLTLADKYNVKDLIHLCLDYMHRHLVSAAGHCQLVSWLQYTLYCGHDKVASQCQDFIKWNFDMIANSSDFVNMETDVLISFLQSSDLVVYHEMALFQSVSRWLDHQESRIRAQLNSSAPSTASGNSNANCNTAGAAGATATSTTNAEDSAELIARMAPLVEEVMSHVRFPMLSPWQLAELLLSKLISRHQSYFIPKMSAAMAHHHHHSSNATASTTKAEEPVVFHHDQHNQQQHHHHINQRHTAPRLYTTERWGALLAIENYPSFPTYGVRTLVFSSPASLAETTSKCEPIMEWSVDLYPKGVWFKKLFLIAWQGPVELPETTVQSVRLSVSLRTHHRENARFAIGVLLYGLRDGVEYVRGVVQRRFVFSADEHIVNIDNLIPYDELNGHPDVAVSSLTAPSSSSSSTSGSSPGRLLSRPTSPPPSSGYLVGRRRDVFKIHVILLPATIAAT